MRRDSKNEGGTASVDVAVSIAIVSSRGTTTQICTARYVRL